MSKQIFEKEGKTYITGRSVSEKVVGEARLFNLDKYAVNQAYIYRHEHPEANPKATVLGRVVDSKIVGTKPDRYQELTIEHFQETKEQKKHLEYLKTSLEAEMPIGFSPAWEEFQKDGTVAEMQQYEYSSTHIPRDPDSKITKVVTMEDKEKQEYETKLTSMRKELDEALGVKKKFEDDMKAVREQYESKVKEISSELVKTNQAFEKMREDFRIATEIEPIVQKIFEFEKRSELLPFYRSAKKEDLLKIYEEQKKKQTPAIITQTMAEGQKEALEGVDKDKRLQDFRKFADEVAKKYLGDK